MNRWYNNSLAWSLSSTLPTLLKMVHLIKLLGRFSFECAICFLLGV